MSLRPVVLYDVLQIPWNLPDEPLNVSMKDFIIFQSFRRVVDMAQILKRKRQFL